MEKNISLGFKKYVCAEINLTWIFGLKATKGIGGVG